MKRPESTGTSRRKFFELAGASAGAALLSRRRLFADEQGIVPTMVNAAAKAKITVQPLRRNISVLEGFVVESCALLVNARSVPE